VAGRIGDRRLFPVEPHSRLHREVLACFERQVLEGVIRHAGDPVMAEQLAWTGVDRFENGDVRRLRKLERSRPIDVSVALALAVWRICTGTGRSVYDSRGVLVLSPVTGEPGAQVPLCRRRGGGRMSAVIPVPGRSLGEGGGLGW
jgi:hypothetical protein